ncbi:MAG: glycosyltransferase family 2 protein [Deltaproteobacteria bacterium]|nr:glycosyltransferase family 2 protein [Deltaproteobacteria bacterium]
MSEDARNGGILYDCTASMVIYQNSPAIIRDAAVSFLNTECSVQLTVVDNSPTSDLRLAFDGLPVSYHFYGENVGYGRAHNWAIFHAEPSKYHLVLNPDIIISSGTIRSLIQFMENNPEVGMVCPRILNEDGSDQYLNKRYPSVMDFFIRRFVPHIFHPLFKRRLNYYEMRDVGYEKMCDVEVMTGAFMLCRTNVLKTVAGFDPRYFLYFEDFDLSRKFQQNGFRTVYYPKATAIHYWTRESHKKIRMAMIFVVNMCRYFSKWGWTWL